MSVSRFRPTSSSSFCHFIQRREIKALPSCVLFYIPSICRLRWRTLRHWWRWLLVRPVTARRCLVWPVWHISKVPWSSHRVVWSSLFRRLRVTQCDLSWSECLLVSLWYTGDLTRATRYPICHLRPVISRVTSQVFRLLQVSQVFSAPLRFSWVSSVGFGSMPPSQLLYDQIMSFELFMFILNLGHTNVLLYSWDLTCCIVTVPC